MQVKKIGHIIMALLLLVSTAGVSINKHYSDGELFSTALFVEAKSCCETPCGCCDESIEFVQLKTDFIGSAFNLEEVSQIDLMHSSISLLTLDNSQKNSNKELFNRDHSPPPLPDLCILNQVFRL